ncbi:hypothetical protein [Pyrodictium abyssi]|uniref:hypothetical protein n=1 Tax=Pyrodictium abyssi TaxID=54256 RepID=UPI0030C6AA42
MASETRNIEIVFTVTAGIIPIGSEDVAYADYEIAGFTVKLDSKKDEEKIMAF